ncbi:MAG: prolipoprotein diacylglyceryl transferase [Firmicutes bacterium]|nr:prolipoprotein diacylglyceryl transferase [Bacillota bacterium]
MSRPPLGSALHVFGLSIAWYSLLIMTAVVIGIWLATREERRLQLPRDTILNFALLAIPLAVVGARLYYVAFTLNRYQNDLLEIFRVWNGGLAIYGAMLGGLLAAILYAFSAKVPLPALLDACVPALALGQAIGRWGNYTNMEAYGSRVYDEALQFFPFAVEIRLLGANGTEYWYWHMATFFYEFVWCLVVFLILMASRKRMKRRGDTLCWYLLLYCAGRTVIEGLRDDSLLFSVAGAQVRVSQLLSALVCVGVIVVFFLRLQKRHKPRLAELLCWCVVASGVACALVGEFERNAYQSLFLPAQILVALLFAFDISFFVHYTRRMKKLCTPAIWMLAAASLCAVTLLFGIGRREEASAVYFAFRQLVAMFHVCLAGVWFYLRTDPFRRRRARRQVFEAETEALVLSGAESEEG